jgi:hypothetical protein
MMIDLRSHAAAVLLTLLVAVCVLAGLGATALIDGALTAPVAVLCAVVTFQALRVPVGRTARRLLER